MPRGRRRAIGDEDGAGGRVGRVDEIAAIDPRDDRGPSSAPRAETVARRAEWWSSSGGGGHAAKANATRRRVVREIGVRDGELCEM